MHIYFCFTLCLVILDQILFHMQSKPPTRKTNMVQDVCRVMVWSSTQSAITIYIHTIWVFCVSHYFENHIYKRPKVDKTFLGNRPKSPNKTVTNVQLFPVFYLFSTSSSDLSKPTLFCREQTILNLESFVQLYRVLRYLQNKNIC